mmetsp:Transcript_19599/g.28856  ORF Transcript_19599/g.28856 Transcript_19599/m.28856 type:complete len:170 (+) Transcript_19599:2-511(+)
MNQFGYGWQYYDARLQSGQVSIAAQRTRDLVREGRTARVRRADYQQVGLVEVSERSSCSIRELHLMFCVTRAAAAAAAPTIYIGEKRLPGTEAAALYRRLKNHIVQGRWARDGCLSNVAGRSSLVNLGEEEEEESFPHRPDFCTYIIIAHMLRTSQVLWLHCLRQCMND